MASGWDNGLCQDYDRKLGAWFADRLGAREELRKVWGRVDERHDHDLLPMQSGLNMITNYDPNISFARHSFELTFMQWDYSLKICVDVLGNCKGADLFSSAVQAAFDDLYDDDDGYSQIILKRPTTDGDESGFDTLEVDLENEDELEKICVGICIVGHVKEQP